MIQYLASIAQEISNAPATKAKATKSLRFAENERAEVATPTSQLERKILQANPVLEAFGNAQTVRNNNSSRFGKFVRIEFNGSGQITGANIEWYLLEKSRVSHQTAKERNYHIFYQLLRCSDRALQAELLFDAPPHPSQYAYLAGSNLNETIIPDAEEFDSIREAMDIMAFSKEEQNQFFKTCATILHFSNMKFTAEDNDQAALATEGVAALEKASHLLGVSSTHLSSAFLRPRIKAGRDWVTQSRNVEQVRYSVEALSRALYERMFGRLVSRINQAMDSPKQSTNFIGVLDIAGFEIFEVLFLRASLSFSMPPSHLAI